MRSAYSAPAGHCSFIYMCLKVTRTVHLYSLWAVKINGAVGTIVWKENAD